MFSTYLLFRMYQITNPKRTTITSRDGLVLHNFLCSFAAVLIITAKVISFVSFLCLL